MNNIIDILSVKKGIKIVFLMLVCKQIQNPVKLIDSRYIT